MVGTHNHRIPVVKGKAYYTCPIINIEFSVVIVKYLTTGLACRYLLTLDVYPLVSYKSNV